MSKYQGNTKRSCQIMKEIIGKIKQKITFCGTNCERIQLFLYECRSFPCEKCVSTSFTEYLTSYNDAIIDSDSTTEEFETACKSLKRNKIAGIDTINSNIVLDTYDEIKDILFLIFKISLQRGTFPNKLKKAKVTPLFKLGDAENGTNYRSISVLPVF